MLTPMQTKKGLAMPLILGLALLVIIIIGAFWYIGSNDNVATTDTVDGTASGENSVTAQGTPVTANGSNTTSGQAVAGWKTYSNAKYGYSIRYPSNWLVGDVAAPTAAATDEVFAAHTASGDMSFRVEVMKNEPQGLDNAPTQTTVTVAGVTRMAYVYPAGRTQCPGGGLEDCSVFIVPIYQNGNWYVLTADGYARTVTGVQADILKSFSFGPSVTTKFENKVYGFAFEYPSNWKVTDLSATVAGKQTAMAKIASPVRKDIAGYEQSGVQYVLKLSFADGKVSIVEQGFIRADTASSQNPTKVTLTPSALSATTEYKIGQQIITSAEVK